jgi:hypothetical protein
MGEIGPVISMCGSGVAGMSDRDILAVISPPASERDRSALVAATSTKLPPQAAWRYFIHAITIYNICLYAHKE